MKISFLLERFTLVNGEWKQDAKMRFFNISKANEALSLEWEQKSVGDKRYYWQLFKQGRKTFIMEIAAC